MSRLTAIKEDFEAMILSHTNFREEQRNRGIAVANRDLSFNWDTAQKTSLRKTEDEGPRSIHYMIRYNYTTTDSSRYEKRPPFQSYGAMYAYRNAQRNVSLRAEGLMKIARKAENLQIKL